MRDGRGPAGWRQWACRAGRAAALVMASALAAPAAAQTTVTVAEARNIGFALLAQGQPAQAAEVARTLIANDPDDAAAQIMLARSLRATGDLSGARRAAVAANRAATTDDARYAAAMELAALDFARERRLLAQFWLRRAAQVAPDPALREAAIATFRQVAAQTPWQISLEFSVVPSSNVNNGSRDTTIEIAGLPFVLSGDAQALSGIETTLGATARYRFQGVGGQAAQFSFSGVMQRVRLSDDARAQAPSAKASDYAYDVIELGFSQVLSAPDAGTLWRLDTALGRNWYGLDPLSNYARAGLFTQWQAGEGSVMSAGLAVERQNRLDDENRSAWVTQANLGRTWQLGSGDVVSVTGGLRNTSSDSIEIDHRAATLAAGYRFARPILGRASLETGLSLEYRDYDDSPFTTDGRKDRRAKLSATLTFPEFDYYGFAPAITFEAQRNQSNVSLYDSEDYGVRLGVRSVF